MSTNTKKDIIKELEKEIDFTRQKLDVLENITSDAIWDWDVNENTIVWNQGRKILFGYKNESNCLDYSSWHDNIHPSDKDEVISNLQNTFENKLSSWEALYRFRCFNGTYKFTYNRGQIIYEDGEPVQITNAMQDIDERMTYVQEVEKLSLVASKTENLVIITDRNGIIEWVNEGFEKKMHYQFSEIIGKSTNVLAGSKTESKKLTHLLKRHNVGLKFHKPTK